MKSQINDVTFTANIYVGLQHGYDSNVFTSIDDVREWLQNYCDKEKFGVTLTPTEFIYVGGRERGVIVGIIQYPRFHRTIKEIKSRAIEIADGLMNLCQQQRVSVVFSDETVMLER